MAASKFLKVLIPAYIASVVLLVLGFIIMIAASVSNPESEVLIGLIGLFLFLMYLIVIVFGMVIFVWMLVDCALRKFKDESQKVLWIILIALFTVLASIIYYYVHGKHPR